MPYPAISSHRMPYDIDGTEVAYGSITAGITGWYNSSQKIEFNDEDWNRIEDSGSEMFIFFPELREVEGIYAIGYQYMASGGKAPISALQGSNDTTNGLDGSWETAVMSSGYPAYVNDFSWRSGIVPVSFSQPVKAIRFARPTGMGEMGMYQIHLYGRKAAGEQPDDLLFVDAATGTEKTALMDWGDQPEGTTEIDSFKVKNASADKIANGINLQLNHGDFLLSWSPDGPWVATLDVATLGVGALSNTVYVKNTLGPPLLILGPYAARVIATVGSWT